MKQFKEFQEAYGRRHDAYTRDYHSSISGMGKHQSAAYHADGGANDEGWDREHHHKPADHPHSVHINGRKWKTFGSHSHATNVARKIKGATVHREEVQLDELSSDTLKSYVHKATSDVVEKKRQEQIALNRSKQTRLTKHGVQSSLNVANDNREKAKSRANGIAKAAMKIASEEVQLDEISDKTLMSYAQKVHDDSMKHDQDPTKRSVEKRNKSVMGFSRALNKLESRSHKESTDMCNVCGQTPCNCTHLSESYEEAEEHKSAAEAAKKKGNMGTYHAHMANHHEAMGQWHESKGRHSVADNHYNKAEEHHEESLKHPFKEESINELSSELLARYKEKAGLAAQAADKAKKYDLGHKRFKGIMKATFKQFANDAKK